MDKKIILDAGHGMNTPGKRTPKDMREWTMNDMVCRYIAGYLLEYDVEVLRCDDISGKTDVDVAVRTNTINYNNPDLFISIHHNAAGNGSSWTTATGVEVYSHPNKPKRDADLAKLLVDEISKHTGLRNRGAKQADFHMIRETKSEIPSVLCEGGFMDSTIDEPVITSEKGQRAYAQAVANVCIAYLELQKKNDSNANEMSTVGTISPNSGMQTPIIGKSVLTAEQMSAFLLSKNIAPLLKCTPLELAQLYIAEGNVEGVRGDIAFAQAIHETGWFKYGNDVKPEQNNYCGLGATGNGVCGEEFNVPQLGVRAHIQHLKAYASKEALKNPCVDPRFSLVTRGIAPTFEQLGGKWAVPGYNTKAYVSFDVAYAAGATYGQSILKIYSDILVFKAPAQPLQSIPSEWAEAAWEWAKNQGITDGTNPQGSITREQTVTMLWRFAKLKGLV